MAQGEEQEAAATRDQGLRCRRREGEQKTSWPWRVRRGEQPAEEGGLGIMKEAAVEAPDG